jgi:hypothetical protein
MRIILRNLSESLIGDLSSKYKKARRGQREADFRSGLGATTGAPAAAMGRPGGAEALASGEGYPPPGR